MAKYKPLLAPDPNVTKFPSGIKYIIGNEGCERFSYYGMRAILYMYIVGLYINHDGMSEEAARGSATIANHTFGAAVYALPMIGALIADRLLGKYKTILYLSVVYCLGHAALAFFENPATQMAVFGEVLVGPQMGLFIGLALIAMGSGGIKPCVSAHVGDQFGRGNWHLLEKVYNAFYFIINFGSFLATILIPIIRGALVVDPETGHFHYEGSVTMAFAIPGILMGLATIAFWMGRKDFVHVPPTHPGIRGFLDVLAGTCLFATVGIPLFIFMAHFDVAWWVQLAAIGASLAAFIAIFTARQKIEQDDGFLAVIFYSIKNLLFGGAHQGGPDTGFWGPARAKWGQEIVRGPIAVLKIMSVFLMVAFFWALFDQHSSTWIAQARDMDRSFDMSTGGWVAMGAVVGLIMGAAVALTVSKSKRRRLMGILVGVGVGIVGGLILDSAGVSVFTVEASQVPSVNPILVMILIPLTTFGFYPFLKRIGWNPHPLRKMTLGMMMAGLSFVAVALIQSAIDSQGKGEVHILWQMIPYVIITSAEVMVSITGLEFGYSQAPKRMKSIIMGFWLLMVAFGNVIVVIFAGLEDALDMVDFFWLFAALMFAAGLIFGLRAKFYKYEDFSQSDGVSIQTEAAAAEFE
ncbi:MAG: POT family proton-dependent oligopeptide transporter [Myxococcota bacterium]|jgi:POT family proton-dependent oligopeptide transporter